MASNICQVCDREIEISIFKGTGFCCQNCIKKSKGEEVIPNRDDSSSNVLSKVRS